ncbi:MAG: carbohydrate kinase family protein [Bacteroidia bacterium]
MAGGAPMNVAYHLNQLGTDAQLISKVGIGQLGKELKRFLVSKHIGLEMIQTDLKIETGQVLVSIKNEEANYEIAFPAAWDFISIENEVAKNIASSDLFIYGSLAARNKTTFNTLRKYLEIAPEKAFDINIRPPHYNWQTLDHLLKASDILKINEEELDLLISHYEMTNQELECSLTELSKEFDISTIICTLGSKGAVLFDQNNFYTCQAKPIKAMDPVGACDSFFATFLHFNHLKYAHQKCLELACKMGGMVADLNGATPSININQVLDEA